MNSPSIAVAAAPVPRIGVSGSESSAATVRANRTGPRTTGSAVAARTGASSRRRSGSGSPGSSASRRSTSSGSRACHGVCTDGGGAGRRASRTAVQAPSSIATGGRGLAGGRRLALAVPRAPDGGQQGAEHVAGERRADRPPAHRTGADRRARPAGRRRPGRAPVTRSAPHAGARPSPDRGDGDVGGQQRGTVGGGHDQHAVSLGLQPAHGVRERLVRAEAPRRPGRRSRAVPDVRGEHQPVAGLGGGGDQRLGVRVELGGDGDLADPAPALEQGADLPARGVRRLPCRTEPQPGAPSPLPAPAPTRPAAGRPPSRPRRCPSRRRRPGRRSRPAGRCTGRRRRRRTVSTRSRRR